MLDPPFRWDIATRSRLGGLLEGDIAPTYPEFADDLLTCCARVIGLAGDADLVFVGRSPESIFDHLSGLLAATSWASRLTLLQFSMRFREERAIRQNLPRAFAGLQAYLTALSLDPMHLAARPRPVAFVDLAASGDTFGRLIQMLHGWCADREHDWIAVARRLRIVGITWRRKTSPNTWRWQQHPTWIGLLQRGAIKNVSVPGRLWDYLGNRQEKVTRSHTPERWADPRAALPHRPELRLQALRLARSLYESGTTQERREAFAAHLATQPPMKHAWLRDLIREPRR